MHNNNVRFFRTLNTHKHLLNPISVFCSQFHQCFTCAFFVQKIGAKNSKPKSKWKKAAQRLSYKKVAHKTLMKLTRGRYFNSFTYVNVWYSVVLAKFVLIKQTSNTPGSHSFFFSKYGDEKIVLSWIKRNERFTLNRRCH